MEKLEKIKFGIQLMVLMLAFPVFLISEMKQADNDRKKSQPELMEAKSPESTEVAGNLWFFEPSIMRGLIPM